MGGGGERGKIKGIHQERMEVEILGRKLTANSCSVLCFCCVFFGVYVMPCFKSSSKHT